jgi:hypothetical protein
MDRPLVFGESFENFQRSEDALPPIKTSLGGKMATAATGKYYLRSVHEEIALFDRKLAHVEKFEKFATDAERDLAMKKMTTKRKALVTVAQRLAAEGVEFSASELPKSLRPEGYVAETPAAAPVREEPAPEAAATQMTGQLRGHEGSPYAGTSLDWQAGVRQYLAKKNRA